MITKTFALLTRQEPVERALFGKRLQVRDLCGVGLVLGSVAGLSEYAIPVIPFFILGWFVYIGALLVRILRYPRRMSPTFMYGIDYGARYDAARWYLTSSLGLYLTMTIVAIISYYPVALVAHRRSIHSDFIFLATALITAPLFFGLIYRLILQWRIIAPAPRDHLPISGLGMDLFKNFHKGEKQPLLALAASIGGENGVIAARQLLYLIRNELIFLFVVLLGLPIAAFFSIEIILPQNQPLAVLTTVIPLFLAFLLPVDTLTTAAALVRTAPYWRIHPQRLLLVNGVGGVVFALPTILVFMVMVICMPSPLPQKIAILLSFFSALILTFFHTAYRWSLHEERRETATMVILMGLLIILTAFVPLWGILGVTIASPLVWFGLKLLLR